jgi:hypothetical protein
MTYFTRLDAAFMSSDLTAQLLGLEEMDYVNTFLESTGDEPQCLRTTHSSMYPLWSGDTVYTLLHLRHPINGASSQRR